MLSVYCFRVYCFVGLFGVLLLSVFYAYLCLLVFLCFIVCLLLLLLFRCGTRKILWASPAASPSLANRSAGPAGPAQHYYYYHYYDYYYYYHYDYYDYHNSYD